MKIFLLCMLVLSCFSHSLIAQGINNSLHFEPGDYVNLDLIAQDIDGRSQFTVEFWVKFDAQQNTDYNAFYAVNTSNYGNRFLIRCAGPIDDAPGSAVVYINDGSAQRIVGATSIGDDKCHHIAFTYNNGACLLYVDGQLDGSGNYIIEPQATDLHSLGQEYDMPPASITSAFYNGTLDDFRIWETAKSQAEIQSQKDIELNGNEANLVTYFNFNQGSADANNSNVTDLNNLARPSHNGTLVNFNLNGSESNFTTGSCFNSLPVELYSFEANVIGKDVLLHWQTTSESNNEKFEIEESRDGIEFSKIGEVNGSESTLAWREYTYQVEDPQAGLNYYRLKQIDFDGEFEHSEVVSVSLERDVQQVGYFYPNPSKSGAFNLSYTSKGVGNVTITVFDFRGRLVFSQSYSVLNGRNILNIILSELNEGVLIAKVDDGASPVYHKLLLQGSHR